MSKLTITPAVPASREFTAIKGVLSRYFGILAFLMVFLAFRTEAAFVSYSNLLSFNGTNGSSPAFNLVTGSDGNFYGITLIGGTANNGTVFKLSTNNFTLTTLVNFNNTNGNQPSSLLPGQDGNLYGTTSFGGPYNSQDANNLGFGTIFQITSNGTFSSIGAFSGSNGANPNGLVQSSNGTFYGTTRFGPSSSNSVSAYGTIYAFGGTHVISNLFAFNNNNGMGPATPLAFGTNSLLYGSTVGGGASFQGTLFDSSTNGAFTNLVSFNTNNGYTPGSLFLAADNNFYGFTFGNNQLPGTLFRLQHNGTLTTLYTFTNSSIGILPTALIQGSDTNFYGLTTQGGSSNNGTFFQFTTNLTITNLYSFTNGVPSSVMQAKDGNFYGFIQPTGTNKGSIFKLSVVPNPAFKSITKTNSTVTFTFSASAGHTYQIQYSTNLSNTNWTALSNVTATNSLATATDGSTSSSSRYYRLLIVN